MVKHRSPRQAHPASSLADKVMSKQLHASRVDTKNVDLHTRVPSIHNGNGASFRWNISTVQSVINRRGNSLSQGIRAVESEPGENHGSE